MRRAHTLRHDSVGHTQYRRESHRQIYPIWQAPVANADLVSPPEGVGQAYWLVSKVRDGQRKRVHTQQLLDNDFCRPLVCQWREHWSLILGKTHFLDVPIAIEAPEGGDCGKGFETSSPRATLKLALSVQCVVWCAVLPEARACSEGEAS